MSLFKKKKADLKFR